VAASAPATAPQDFVASLLSMTHGSTFKRIFRRVCLLLYINFHVAAKGNHKAVSVEHFH
jgi:hypothetical protein